MPPSLEKYSNPNDKHDLKKDKSKSTTPKKRVRRSYEQLNRNVKCEYCDRSYASEHSMHQHIRLKHIAPSVALRPLANTVLLPKVDHEDDMVFRKVTPADVSHPTPNDSRGDPMASSNYTMRHGFTDPASSYSMYDRYQGGHRYPEYLQDIAVHASQNRSHPYSPHIYYNRSRRFPPRVQNSAHPPRNHSNDALPWRSINQSFRERREDDFNTTMNQIPFSQSLSGHHIRRSYDQATDRHAMGDDRYLGYTASDGTFPRCNSGPSISARQHSLRYQQRRPTSNDDWAVDTNPRVWEDPEYVGLRKVPNMHTRTVVQSATGDDVAEPSKIPPGPSDQIPPGPSDQISKGCSNAESALLKLKNILNGLSGASDASYARTNSSKSTAQRQQQQQQFLQQHPRSNPKRERKTVETLTSSTLNAQIQIGATPTSNTNADMLANFLKDNALLSQESSDFSSLAETMAKTESSGTSTSDIGTDAFATYFSQVQYDTEASNLCDITKPYLNSR
ncbi:hypothetical protein SARC_02436 [Sphaeroforma arctica JP610]|uniref:C2H2-type domain-containing protein n=1 Tax=Sphaeroforma arctica JP610 TaxID=667725 RepID=A0A0L0GAT2_9EUKA|nr:hypothetical protein SARC_02436 [Sphaeroforma arctica JP610]KNC85378.1 hypothetical protein SARC_02436 [Sphaeroforma arctica JP610]|eukprot:XP_014159280.1 hypothetical protein SARC_02436 [Sphaeroforma arctica JP610]